MAGGPDLEDRRETVAHRVEFIELLADEGPMAPRDLVDALPHSRATVTRALRELRDADLVEKRDGGYRSTVAGVLAAEEYRRYRDATDAVLSAESLLAPLPTDEALPVEALVDAQTILAEGDIPVRALEAVSDRVEQADRIRLYLPTLVNTHLLRVWHRALLASAVETTAIFDPDLLTVLKGQYPHLLAEMATVDGFAAYSMSGPPFGIVWTETDGEASVAIIVYEDDTVVRGVMTNDAPAAVQWAETRLETMRTGAAEVTADLAALTDAVSDGLTAGTGRTADRRSPEPAVDDEASKTRGHSLPLELEAEGFVRLSESYFDAHSRAPPAVSWRTGFTLAEVHGGHAVDRLDADGRNLIDRLVDAVQSGTDYVVLGPPGSGKSTVCMSVACEWYDRGLGPVLYRERGDGRFDSAALLEAYLRQTDGHALVVVEDAVRDEANAVFEVMQALDAEPSVSFLLDARTHEWQSSEAVDIDPRRDAYRRSAIERLTVPGLDEMECARFIDRFSELVDTDLDLTGADLLSLVEVSAGDELTAGDVLLAQHHLARRLDPSADANGSMVTALDDAVRRTYEQLTGAEASLVGDLAVLVALLTAAGIPVAREHLYALAEPEGYDAIDEAIGRLEGRVLFGQNQPRVGSPTTYRTRHETWAVGLLEQVRVQESMHDARDRFGRPISRLLGLADEPDRRRAIQAHLSGRTPHLHRIEADPGGWADGLVERIFEVGLTNASLAPLYGATDEGPLRIPGACSAWSRLRVAFWRGEMNRTHGDLARAEREYRTLGELAEDLELVDEPRRRLASPAFARGRDTAENDPGVDRTRWLATSRTRLGTVARERGEYEAAQEHHADALELFREIGDRGGEAISLKNLGIVAFYRSEFDTAREYYERSLDLAEEIDARRTQADCLNNLGGIAWKQGAYDRAREYLERSLSLSRELGDEQAEYSILNNLGDIAQAQDDYDRAREYYAQSLTIFRDLGDRPSEATILTNLGQVAKRQGAYDEARAFFEQSLEIKRELGDRSGASQTLRDLGEVDLAQGWYDRAGDFLEESISIELELGDREGEASSRRAIGEQEIARGASDRAAEQLRQSLELAEELDARSVAADSRLSLGRVALDSGDLAEADDHLVAAHHRFEDIGSDLGIGRCRLNQGRVALAQGEIGTARDQARKAREAFEAIGADHWTARSRLLLGHIEAAAGAPEDACTHWGEALQTFERVDVPPDALATVEALLEACLDLGNEDQAREWCQRAQELVEAAPEPTAANHYEWVQRQTTALEGD